MNNLSKKIRDERIVRTIGKSQKLKNIKTHAAAR
jgi:hypothetical protein